MRSLIAAIAVALPVFPALAQVMPAPLIVRATVDQVTGNRVAVTTRDGDKQTLTLAPDAQVASVTKVAIDAIQPGSFVGTAAAPGPEGRLQAIEVHVFPESMRGAGEGQRKWDLAPGSTMTAGTVGTVSGSSGRLITVRYEGFDQNVVVPADAPIVTFEPGDRSLIVPGAKIMSVVKRDEDGRLVTNMVRVGKGGISPPM